MFFSDLSPTQKIFAARVISAIRAYTLDEVKPVQILGDGTGSPNGERFVAVLAGSFYSVAIDFGTGSLFSAVVAIPAPACQGETADPVANFPHMIEA